MSTAFGKQVVTLIQYSLKFTFCCGKSSQTRVVGQLKPRGPPHQDCEFMLLQQSNWLERQGIGAGNQKWPLSSDGRNKEEQMQL